MNSKAIAMTTNFKVNQIVARFSARRKGQKGYITAIGNKNITVMWTNWPSGEAIPKPFEQKHKPEELAPVDQSPKLMFPNIGEKLYKIIHS